MRKIILLYAVLLLFGDAVRSQEVIQNMGNRIRNAGGGGRQMGGFSSGTTDSLQRRDRNADSISIHYRYLDTTRTYRLDSSVGDFSRWFPLPSTSINLGNSGTAARSLLFSPNFRAGFDAGFHVFDTYRFLPEKMRFFHTTRPYSELNYQLGSRVEQIIHLLHTQNLKPGWNVSFQYRLINSPGFFKNQKTNHNNYLLNSGFQSVNRRYTNYVMLVGNKMQSAENGGLQDTAANYLKDPIYKDRFNIPTKIGGDDPFSSNFFTTKISTGNLYSDFTFLLRQQYDLGKKDSLVTDSTVIPLFYPRLRFEHTLRLENSSFTYIDYLADSVYYKTYYDTSLRRPQDSLVVKDKWKILENDFSVYQYPDAKNLQQFIKLGVLLQTIKGTFVSGSRSFVNTVGHAEYRNRTRNQRWDIEASGRFYFTGNNQSDYEAHISLQRMLGNKTGTLQLGFENASRTPSFVFDSRSSFYFAKTARDFKKENNTHFFASYFLPSFRFRLTGHYYLSTNYTYFTDYFRPEQEGSLFNVLQIAAQKTFKVGKRWKWHAEFWFQQAVGDAPVNIPLLYTRQRFAYEGNLGFRNLDIAMGIEARYRSPYKASAYSPVQGQFFYQDSISIRNPLPDLAAYLHFRIRPFKAFVRAENLNTARNLEGFSFTNNNLVAPGYALPGLQFRLGVYWSFVN